MKTYETGIFVGNQKVSDVVGNWVTYSETTVLKMQYVGKSENGYLFDYHGRSIELITDQKFYLKVGETVQLNINEKYNSTNKK